MKGKLTLKQELAPIKPEPPVGQLIVAQVWVDASVYHLDGTFSYLIPGNLHSKIEVGSFVSVPFHGREVIALVVSIEAHENISGLKYISKPIGEIPLVPNEILALIREASARYAAHPFDLIRSAIPDRLISVEREYLNLANQYRGIPGSTSREYLQLPPHRDRSHLIAAKVAERSKVGGVIVVLPDSREVARLSEQLSALSIEHSTLDSKLPRSELFANFLELRRGVTRVAIGTRSVIFAPVSELRTVVIYNEGSEHFYEQRTPGWNVRDIALLRSRHQDFETIFIGYSPSAEISRLIEEKWVRYKRARAKVLVKSFSPEHGELLPSRAIPPLKRALADGPTLFIVPLKGYAQAIRCSKCRTISHCTCGGSHEKPSHTSPIRCNHCLTTVTQWRCAWCHSEVPTIQSRGAERHHHELGLLFPGTPSHISTSDHLVESTIDQGIVIATPGMAPLTERGYAAVVFLEGNRFLSQPDMRSQERVREMYFSHSALAQEGGTIFLIQDEGYSISTALSTWNPIPAIQRELEERESLHLPPYVRSVKLTMATAEITRLEKVLAQARDEGRIPASTSILGPIANGERSSLILSVPVSKGDELVSMIHEFMRRRSAAKKSLPSLLIDPYSLSN